MTDQEKPYLLMMTSSFPRDKSDETCGYIRDFARNIACEFNVIVLTVPEEKDYNWTEDSFTLIRSSSILPASINPLRAGSDLTEISRRSLLIRLAAMISLISFAIDALMLARRVDVICSHWMLPSGLIGAILSRLLGKPHVVVEHSGALHMLKWMRGGRRLAKFIVNGSHRIITVSRDLRDKLVELCPNAEGKIESIPMGVDVTCISSSQIKIAGERNPAISHTVLFLGRLVQIKGVDVLMKAVKECDGLRLMIAGDGDERQRLEAMARSNEIDAIFLGRVSAEDRNDLLQHCDIAVIPSLVLADGRTEGTPVSALEAMVAGLPLIASRVGGLKELIIDGYNGLLFESGDHVMLAEKLRLLMSDASLRNELSANAHATVTRYDWSMVGLRYREILRSICVAA